MSVKKKLTIILIALIVFGGGAGHKFMTSKES